MGGVLVDEPHVPFRVLADDIGLQHLARHAPGLLRRGGALRHGDLLLLRLRGRGRGGRRLRSFRRFLRRCADLRRCDVIHHARRGRRRKRLVRLRRHIPNGHRRCGRHRDRRGPYRRRRHYRPCRGRADGLPRGQHRRLRRLWRIRSFQEFLCRHGLIEGLFRRFWPPLAVQRVFYGVVHRVEHRFLGGEFHHRLGRVDVHVHLVHRQRDVQHTAGELPLQQPVAVGLLHGGGQQLAFYQPPVDKEQLPRPGAVPRGGTAHKAAGPHVAAAAVHLQQAFGKIPAQCSVDRRQQLPVAGGVQHLLPIPQQLEGHLRMAERQLCHHSGSRRALGTVLFHEFHSRRGVVEQVPHTHGGALRAPGGRDLTGHAALPMQGRAAVGAPRTGENIQP